MCVTGLILTVSCDHRRC